ncbi:UNVERIFIED_CONTAM: hypothetical protein RMT77_002987 [Armadillidium vulgare]
MLFLKAFLLPAIFKLRNMNTMFVNGAFDEKLIGPNSPNYALFPKEENTHKLESSVLSSDVTENESLHLERGLNKTGTNSDFFLPFLKSVYFLLRENEEDSIFNKILLESLNDLSVGISDFKKQIITVNEKAFNGRASIVWLKTMVPIFFRDIFFSLTKILLLSVIRFFSPDFFKLLTSFSIFSLLG